MNLILLCGVVLLTTVPPSKQVVVRTNSGAVRGQRTHAGPAGYIDTYFGIPYAAPPVGPLRFKAPQAAHSWTGTRNATSFPPMCPQLPKGDNHLPLPISEDCLFLNIYVPKLPANKTQLPVMVGIHGGGYVRGAGSKYNGTHLAERGVVVVTINYRLGVLGFLSTMDDACSGNFGLLDQILALKWVKDNIAHFHGDPNDVTLFGESAGGFSISLLRLSPLAQGLFNKAIMQSGVSLSPWAVTLTDRGHWDDDMATELARSVDCGPSVSAGHQALISCLRNVSVDTILHASSGFHNIRPVVESVAGVIPHSPLSLLVRGMGSNITSIRGTTKDEYASFMSGGNLDHFSQAETEAAIASFARAYFTADAQTVASRLTNQYLTSQHLTTNAQRRQALIQMHTDHMFLIPALLEQEHSVTKHGHADQYLYQFTYLTSHPTLPAWKGAHHASELPFLFGLPFAEGPSVASRYSDQDRQVSDYIITLWTNFAKYGNPTPDAVGGVTWPAFTLDSQNYLDIGSSLTPGVNLAADRLQFWATMLGTVSSLIG